LAGRARLTERVLAALAVADLALLLLVALAVAGLALLLLVALAVARLELLLLLLLEEAARGEGGASSSEMSNTFRVGGSELLLLEEAAGGEGGASSSEMSISIGAGAEAEAGVALGRGSGAAVETKGSGEGPWPRRMPLPRLGTAMGATTDSAEHQLMIGCREVGERVCACVCLSDEIVLKRVCGSRVARPQTHSRANVPRQTHEHVRESRRLPVRDGQISKPRARGKFGCPNRRVGWANFETTCARKIRLPKPPRGMGKF
jgi:hypothetical protein